MPSPASPTHTLRERLQRAVGDRYTVEVEVDRGGRGAVYRARDLKHGRRVAIKVLLPEAAGPVGVQRFLQEINIAARLNHPHILPLHDSGEAAGLVYFVMPFVQGRSLRDRLEAEHRLPLEDVTRIAGEVASALDRAHGEGIIHRDIKPANILLIGNYAVVTDFGIARAMDPEANLVDTESGTLEGTAAYMSPEQATGAQDLDGRTDLYSLGCTVFEMLTGRPPFVGESLRRLIAQHVVDAPPSVRSLRRDVPEHMDQAVRRALAKERDERFDTLMDFANALTRPTSTRRWATTGTAVEGGLLGRLRSAWVRPEAAPAPDEASEVPEGEAVPCGSCGLENPAGSRFCRSCGKRLEKEAAAPAALAARPAPSEVAPPADARPRAPETPQAELRQLTVMTIDAAPHHTLSHAPDPEAELEAMRLYQAACLEAVTRYDGHLVEQGGHRLSAYFGHPVAHEDDPVRAALAGLAVLEATQSLNARSLEEEGPRLDVRVGIHTGPAVIGAVGADQTGDRVAIGQTPLLAARLCDQAPPSSVLASDVTHQLFRDYFTCQAMEPVSVEGFAEEIGRHRVLAESGVGRQLSTFGAGDLPPLVGREAEVETILAAWKRAQAGSAQLVLVTGEAGIGKSRLVAAVTDAVAGSDHLFLEGSCSAYHTSSALYAIANLLERWVGIRQGDAPDVRLEKLEAGVLPFLSADPEAVPLLAGLLAIPLGGRYQEPALEPALKRRRTLDLLLALLRAASSEVDVLVVLEDLHWVDPSTLDFLNMWLDRARTTRVMILLDARPEFHAPWDAPHVTRVALAGLDGEMAARVVEGVTGGKSLPRKLVDEIVRRADGVPLFVEETTRALLESETVVDAGDRYELAGPLSALQIPLTLRDALTARMDRLGDAKAHLQLAAVIGREFSAALLLEVAGSRDWIALGKELERAVEAGILESSGSGLLGVYRFRHALIQENAYQSLVKRTRQAHHRRIMVALEERFPELAEANPELLARHCTDAGALAEAVPYWRRAGLQSIARAAFAEAVQQLQRGLEILHRLPEGATRDEEELRLQTALALALQASKGYAAPEVERIYERARVLVGRGGSAKDLLPVLWGQHLFHNVNARYSTCREVAGTMLDLARRDGDREHLLVAHLAMGLATLYLGELTESRALFREALDLYRPDDRPPVAYDYLGDPGPFCYSYLARTLWILGEVDEAFHCSHESLGLARAKNLPLTWATAMGMHSILLLVHGDPQARQYVEETCDFAGKRGFAYWFVLTSMCKGWLMAQDGLVDEGITQFRRFLDAYKQQGAKLGLSWFNGILSQMYERKGDAAAAAALLEESRAHMAATGEGYYAPEIHRLQGELARAAGGPGALVQAEAHLTDALQLARGQRSASWELRAAISLATLWREQGREGEARDALGILGKMPRQADPSSDVRLAKRLLEELSARA